MVNLCTVLAAPDPFADRADIVYICRELKLHLDLDSGQVAVRLQCAECGKKGSYWCYNSIEDAMWATSEREEQLCPECWDKEYKDLREDLEEGNFDYPVGHSCRLGEVSNGII